MLILSRRREEEIVIGDTIRIKILRSRGGRVRIGIAAPPEVEVKRGEIRPSSTPPESTDAA